jgi:protein-L-isoaspartate(D-aspartate) O-methyltransferase
MRKFVLLILSTTLFSFVLALAAGPAGLVAPALAKVEAPAAWSFQAFARAYEESGRSQKVSELSFAQIQANRQRALATIERYLQERFGRADPLVLKAFAEVPREYFHYHYQDKHSFADKAYEESAKPWAIGYGSALSDYLGQAYMTQLAKPTPDAVVLEIGTGSGFQVSVLSRIVKKAYSIEIIEPLGQAVARIFKPLGYHNVETRVGDGFFGWPEVKGGFDIIIVTCAAQYVPPALLEQLKPGGRLIIPIGQPFKKGQFLYVYTKDAYGKVHSRKDVGVYFIPMTGEQQRRAPASS